MARGRALVPLLLLAALAVQAAGNGGPQTTAEGQHWPPAAGAAAHPPLAPPALTARKAIQRSTNSSTNGTAAAAARASKRQSLAWKHKRRPCAENDAKCIALRDHECDPYFANVTDKCTFVQWNRACQADVHQINYLSHFYCAHDDGRALVALGFVAWMAVLFWVMAVVAQDFLVPALEFLAHKMRMAPDVAGVTLFAFASGAPDLFTQIAAVAAGGHVDQELAISATLGGGLFIVSVVFVVVALVRKSGAADDSEPHEITDRRAFVRDAVAYALSVLALLGLMLRGTFSAWEATFLLVGYGAYLAVCIITSRAGGPGSGGGGSGHRHAYFAVTPSQEQLQMAEQQAMVGSQSPAAAAAAAVATAGGYAEAAEPFGGSTGMQLPRQLSGVVVAGGAALPGQQLELVSRAGGTTPQRKSAAQLAALEGGSRPASPLPLREKPLVGEPGGAGEDELASLVGGQLASDGGALGAAASAFSSPRGALRSKLAAGHSSRMGKLVHSASLGLEELLHLHGKSGPRLWLSLAMAPAMLLLHATMPALHPGYYTPMYAAILSLGAPLFALLGTEHYPHRLSTVAFLLTWLLSALVLLALTLLVVRPAGSSGQQPQQQHAVQRQSSLSGPTVAVTAIASGSPLGSAPPPASPQLGRGGALGGSSGGGSKWAWARQRLGARRQRRNVLMSLLAAAQCMLWMSLAADELVALFQAIGRICDISQDLLGATVLAWGEAVPELAATLTLARQGQGTMALAAVYGGPVFNVLVAWSAPTLYAALRHGPMTYQLSPGVGILVAFTLGVLCLQLVAIPLLRWRLDRRAAAAVLALFVLAQAFFVSKELL